MPMNWNKNLLWNYIGYGISLAINILLLPVVLKFLNNEELGLWYVFMSVGTFVAMVDFGFSPQIARFVTYAYAGADSLKKKGIVSATQIGMNIELLQKLLVVSRRLYFFLSLFVFILLITIGTYYVCSITKMPSLWQVLCSWIFFCIASFVNILYGYYNAFFRGIGDFVSINKAILLSKCVQIFCSFIGLYLGYGLFAVAFSFFLSGIFLRIYLGIALRRFGKENSFPEKKDSFDVGVLSIIWHNSWREGVVMISRYLIIQSNTILCSLYINLIETASYALAVQILTIISSVSLIYFTTNLPKLGTARVTDNVEYKNKLLSKTWFIYIVSYILMLLLLFVVGIPIIEYIKPNVMLENSLLLFVALYMFLEANQSLFVSYISTSNKLPYVFPYLISAASGVVIAIILLEYTDLGIWGIVFAHFVVQLCYNNWKWPYYVFKESKMNMVSIFK